MKCCVPFCDKFSDRVGEYDEEITFHLFPSDECQRESWINAIYREPGWNPTKHTKICSLHFEEKDFYRTKKGYRKIKQGVVPTLSIVKLGLEETEDMNQENVKNVVEHADNVVDNYLTLNDTPREKMLKHEIRRLKIRERKLHLKVRRLQMATKRLKEKNANNEAVISSLKRMIISQRKERSSLVL